MKSIRDILRGGSWNNNENNLRSSNRNNNNPDNTNNNIGFRCASAPSTPSLSQNFDLGKSEASIMESRFRGLVGQP